MAVGLGPQLVLGIAMPVNFECIDAWQQRRFPDVRITPTRWQGAAFVVFGIAVVLIGEVVNAVCGSALDAPTPRSGAHDRASLRW